MIRKQWPIYCLLMVVLTTIGGCILRDQPRISHHAEPPNVDLPSTQFDSANCVDEFHTDLITTTKPLTLDNKQPPKPRDLSLDEAISMALQSSTVMRDLEGTVIKTPALIRTIHDPAIIDTDPRFGEAAALAAFDAEISTRMNVEKNDRPINNIFFGGGTRIFTQDVINYESQITKRAATGTEFTFRQTIDYDANNAPSNEFPSVWQTAAEAEFRHPLLRGGGVQFNRIAGPNGEPGVINGVLIARLSTDVAIADFEIGIRDLVNDVENAYWDLYYTYRDLDAKIEVRDAALRNWREMKALLDTGDAAKDQEAQAREQLFRFEEEVQDALVGRLLEGTRSDNGSLGGTFRGNSGVHVAERRLRLLIGLPINDGTLLRPTDQPTLAKIIFSWHQIGMDALTNRVELRKQRIRIKRRELELQASENFLLPRLDLLARYRFRGLGQDLINPQRIGGDPFNNAFQNMTGGNFQEWQLGFEFNMPFGFRSAHAALHNAQLLLARNRTILREQSRHIIRDLTDAYDQVQLSYGTAKNAYNRQNAAIDYYNSILANYKNGRANAEELLEGTRRLADAKTHYHRRLVEYTLAIKNVNLEKGSLLDYNKIYLAENLWDRYQQDQCIDCYNEELDYGTDQPLEIIETLPAENQQLPIAPKQPVEPIIPQNKLTPPKSITAPKSLEPPKPKTLEKSTQPRTTLPPPKTIAPPTLSQNKKADNKPVSYFEKSDDSLYLKQNSKPTVRLPYVILANSLGHKKSAAQKKIPSLHKVVHPESLPISKNVRVSDRAAGQGRIERLPAVE